MVPLEPNSEEIVWLDIQEQRISPMNGQKRKTKLTPKTRQKIIGIYNEELRAAGLCTFDDLKQLVAKDDVHSTINLGLLGKLENILDRMEEPTPKELEQIISETSGKLRYAIRPTMVQVIKEVKARLLKKKKGDSLTPQQKSAACDEVAALIRKKVPYPIALKRVGSKFGKSARTIQRAWQNRGDDTLP